VTAELDREHPSSLLRRTEPDPNEGVLSTGEYVGDLNETEAAGF